MKLEELLNTLYNPELKSIDMGLERVENLLAALDNPHLRMPPVIHVAGTNGKGSTIAFARSILQAHGKVCHVYTSPHLVRFNERIVVAGEEISDEDLLIFLNMVKHVTTKYPATFFEATTTAAFLAFTQTKADFVLLETGMGGRLDATNVMPRPLLTAITSISMDHEEYLGDTLKKVALEKAGILKSGVPCVMAPQTEEAERVIRSRAADLGSEVIYPQPVINLPLSLNGDFQKINSSVAMEICKIALGKEFSVDQAEQGLQLASWPARFERITKGKIANLLPKDTEIWLDGCHNAGGAMVLAQELLKLRQSTPNCNIFAIIGMLKNKDAASILSCFKTTIERAFTIKIPDAENSLDSDELSRIAVENGIDAHPADGIEDALQRIRSVMDVGRKSKVVIFGSLYLAGEVLKFNAYP
jgi:dihydrofolate synthase/folylpolyglutamate synthase